MTTQQQLTDFLSQTSITGLGGTNPGYRSWRAPSTFYFMQPRPTPEEIAEELLTNLTFRALRLGTWLGTPDGEMLVTAVELADPAFYTPDVALLVDGLKLAASIQRAKGSAPPERLLSLSAPCSLAHSS